MAADALPIVAEETGKIAAAANKALSDLADDPVHYTGRLARKWGVLALGAGILSFILAQVGKKLDQSYLNDITNVLGIPQQAPPTQGTTAAPPAPPVAPPMPPQVALVNQLVQDVNRLSTTSASANVALLQDALTQLWSIVGVAYGVTNGLSTQTPFTGTNPTGGAQGLGPQLAICIAECSLIIEQFKGANPSGGPWEGTFWTNMGVYPLPGQPANPLLVDITNLAQQPYSVQGVTDWPVIEYELSNVANAGNFKQSINGLCYYLNVSQPFNVQTPTNGNFWGILGAIVADLSGAGAVIEQDAGTVVKDLVAFGSDVAGIVSDIPSAIALIGKVLLNLPRLGFDALGYAVWWAADMAFNAIWLPLVIVGAIAIAYSVFALNIYPRMESRIKLGVNARAARFWNAFDKRFHSRRKVQEVLTEKSTQASIDSANANPVIVPPVVKAVEPPISTPPSIEAEAPAEPKQSEPETAGERDPVPVTQPPPEHPSEPGEKVETLPEVSEPVPAPENALATPSREPTSEELEEMERNRLETLPVVEPEPERLGGKDLADKANWAFAGGSDVY